ncbi:hypothetical protein EON63_16325 [archaeon]|nr:MAG: hypothetical protein EON63_16325 [archaeon]
MSMGVGIVYSIGAMGMGMILCVIPYGHKVIHIHTSSTSLIISSPHQVRALRQQPFVLGLLCLRRLEVAPRQAVRWRCHPVQVSIVCICALCVHWL